jgi:hypothetical protein
MKFEARTLQILKNFSVINPSLQFKEGSTLSTVSPNKTVMSKAAIKEHIPSTFAIYDLSKFLGVLSLFDSPEISLEEKYLIIKGNNKQVQYTYADPRNIVIPGDKEIKLPESEINFTLTSDTLQSVLKGMGVLGLPELAVSGENGVLSVQAVNVKNPSSDNFSIDVGQTPLTFKMIFLAENIKIIQDDYDVSISSKGIAHFKGKDIEYWVATESSSTFKG